MCPSDQGKSGLTQKHDRAMYVSVVPNTLLEHGGSIDVWSCRILLIALKVRNMTPSQPARVL